MNPFEHSGLPGILASVGTPASLYVCSKNPAWSLWSAEPQEADKTSCYHSVSSKVFLMCLYLYFWSKTEYT